MKEVERPDRDDRKGPGTRGREDPGVEGKSRGTETSYKVTGPEATEVDGSAHTPKGHRDPYDRDMGEGRVTEREGDVAH